MKLTQTNSFNGQLIEKNENNEDVVSAYVTASLDTSNYNVSINVNMQDKDSLTASSAAQYKEFYEAVAAQGKALGFPIFQDAE